jgi:hypothetical protein
MTRLVASAVGAICIIAANLSNAQEVCFKDAKKNFENWKTQNSKVLNDLAAQYNASKDPSKEMVTYAGMRMPVAAAIMIEGEKYGREADGKVEVEVNAAKKCSGQTTIPRGVYDLAREWMGVTTILPEQATRIDFEELRRGNIAGGENSVIRETGRAIEQVVNPFRWKW